MIVPRVVEEADLCVPVAALFVRYLEPSADCLIAHRRMSAERDHDVQRRTHTADLIEYSCEEHPQRTGACRVRNQQEHPLCSVALRGTYLCDKLAHLSRGHIGTGRSQQ